MNKHPGRFIPWFILGIIITSVTYITRTPTWQLSMPGPELAVAILGFMALAFPFVILRRAQDALVAFSLIKARATSPYWPLVPLALLLWGFQYQTKSSTLVPVGYTAWDGKPVLEFSWGGGDCTKEQFLLLLLVLFLHEVYLTVKAVGEYRAGQIP